MYEELIGDVLTQFNAAVKQLPSARALPQPLPLVCTGGVAQVAGFTALLEDLLRDIMFPLAISDIRCASEAEYTVARGSLITAEVEESVKQHARVA